MYSKLNFVLFVFCLLYPINIFSQINFPAFISDNMVLQQQTEAPLWGWANKSTDIIINCEWDNRTYYTSTNSEGKWSIKVKTPEAGGPFKIFVNNDTINNILIGEVWVCSGQSNMQWALDNTDGGLEEIDRAYNPQIRFFYAARMISDKPLDDCYGQWVECTPHSARTFSAVGYYFGKKIHKGLNIPVGLVHTSWGGSPAEAWIKEKILKSDPDYNIYYRKQNRKELEAEPGILPLTHHSPSRLYNAMIHPFIPYAIKGAIWYQGESNTGEPILYEKLFPAMIQNWREDWKQGDFPFYYVQLAPYNYNIPFQGALLRDAQRKSLSIPNTGMAVTMDIGNPDDIHPRNKLDVGERLALLALANNYGQNELVFSGPLYKDFNVEENKIRVHFEYIGSGLVARGGDLTHFEIAGEDKYFFPAIAKIDGETIIVESQNVQKPIAVRYAFHDTDEPNLFNKEGLPASSFRTDDWPIITESVNILSSFDIQSDKFIIKLETNAQNSQIRYTTDGSEPDINSNLYSKPFASSGTTNISARVFIDNIPSVDIARSELLRHKASGRKVKYKNKFSSRYTGGGKYALVNSIKGSDNFNDGRWQGFEGEDLDIIIDLSNNQTLSKIVIGTLQSIDAWIFFPKNISVLISDDGTNFKEVTKINNEISPKLERTIINEFEISFDPVECRYVKIVAENIKTCPDWHQGAGGKSWIFFDEITID